MNNDKKAPDGRGKPPRASEEGGVSMNNYITDKNGCQTRISDFLHHGADNPTSRRELVCILGWRDRDITRAIECERRAGTPIVANGRGYYLPAIDFELDEYLQRLQHREREIKRTRLAVAQTRQERLDLSGGGV